MSYHAAQAVLAQLPQEPVHLHRVHAPPLHLQVLLHVLHGHH